MWQDAPLDASVAEEPELAIVRLVVSIAKCHPMETYYTDVENVQLACEYNGIKFVPDSFNGRIGRRDLAIFFQKLQSQPAIFASFFEYTLTDVIPTMNLEDFGGPDRRYFDLFVKDLRLLGYEAQPEEESGWKVKLAIGGSNEEKTMLSSLDEMLREIDPRFVEMRVGARNALLSEDPDSERQAIASTRELLNQCINELGEGATRSQRVFKILGGKDVKTIAAAAQLVNALYGLQSKGEHKEPSFERALFVIKLTEDVLYYILKNRPR